MSVGLVMLILPSKVDRQALRATLQTKYQELGPVTSEQKRAAILMLVTLILLATDKLHGVAAGLVLIGVTFAAFLPGVRLLDGPKFSKVNFAPLFFIMGCMTIGSAGGFLKVTTWIANNTLPYLHGMTTTTAGLASYVPVSYTHLVSLLFDFRRELAEADAEIRQARLRDDMPSIRASVHRCV